MTRSKIMASLEDMRFDDGYKSKNSSKSKLHSLFGSFSKVSNLCGYMCYIYKYIVSLILCLI